MKRIQAAKGATDARIERWSEGRAPICRAIVDHAWVNKQGRIDVNQVLSLRNLAIDDDEWKAAMDAIADAITNRQQEGIHPPYQREPSGKYV